MLRSHLNQLQERFAVDADADGAARVVRSASELFVSNGYQGTSTDAIAKQADVRPSELYRLFGSKDAILVAALENLFEGFLADMDAAVAGVSEPSARLVRLAWAHTWVQLSFDVFARGAVGMMFSTGQLLSSVSEERVERLRGFARRQVEHVRETVERGTCDGAFSVPDVRTATQAIVTIAEYAPLWYRPGGPLAPEDVADRNAIYALRIVNAQVEDYESEVRRCLSDEVVARDVRDDRDA